ncbi:hypothetical protein M2175_007062 [Bradyrhizobium elkanii]|uniref:hypothetical protein n=1 Tax=Bradyrhizobium TaxID=374 RepID=UPI00216873A3|nr:MULTISPECIES: hypothetical protein [Bradyrhizobium]MCS3932031.1 hypothetical protein [Bradyrhizobium elkanii]MCS3972588.1 hypothetical protein [Bradyrhizobium japonicum]
MISSTIFVQKAQPQEFVVRLTLVFPELRNDPFAEHGLDMRSAFDNPPARIPLAHQRASGPIVKIFAVLAT